MEKVGEFELLPKKEVAILKAERAKLEKNLGGIKEMTELPGVVFVVDPKKEHIAVKEARALHLEREVGVYLTIEGGPQTWGMISLVTRKESGKEACR